LWFTLLKEASEVTLMMESGATTVADFPLGSGKVPGDGLLRCGQSLHLGEEGVEAEERGLPALAVALGPVRDVLEGGGVEAAEVGAADDATADELGALEDADVLGGGGEGHFEGRGELAEILLVVGELAEDGATGRVGEGVEDAVESGGAI
jgi:hypothetical protein